MGQTCIGLAFDGRRGKMPSETERTIAGSGVIREREFGTGTARSGKNWNAPQFLSPRVPALRPRHRKRGTRALLHAATRGN